MRKLLLAASAVLMATAPAATADLGGPRTSPYYAPTLTHPLFNWTGFYVGGNAGWAWGSALGADPSGYLVGLQAGYNFQYASGLLAGIETDIAISGIDGSGGGLKFDLNYLGTVRGRLGYAMDRVLFYATGGLAYGRGEVTTAGLSSREMHLGWAVGAGIETMLAPNVTARIEYLYTDLGRENYTTAAGTTRVGFDASIVRVGLNYKF